MHKRSVALAYLLISLCSMASYCVVARAETASSDTADGPQTQPSGSAMLARVVARWVDTIEPTEGQIPQTFTAHLKITSAHGVPSEVAGASGAIAFQAPLDCASAPRSGRTPTRPAATATNSGSTSRQKSLPCSGTVVCRYLPRTLRTWTPRSFRRFPFRFRASRLRRFPWCCGLNVCRRW